MQTVRRINSVKMDILGKKTNTHDKSFLQKIKNSTSPQLERKYAHCEWNA